jgi:hypothetical protein
MIALFEELETMPTPSPYRRKSPVPAVLPSRICPFSPSSITEPSSPPAKSSHSSLKLKALLQQSPPTFEEYCALEKEKDDALRKILHLEERLDDVLEMQVVTSKKVEDLLQQLKRARSEVESLRAFLKAEGECLIQASL